MVLLYSKACLEFMILIFLAPRWCIYGYISPFSLVVQLIRFLFLKELFTKLTCEVEMKGFFLIWTFNCLSNVDLETIIFPTAVYCYLAFKSKVKIGKYLTALHNLISNTLIYLGLKIYFYKYKCGMYIFEKDIKSIK